MAKKYQYAQFEEQNRPEELDAQPQQEAEAPTAEPAPADETLDFDAWYAMREAKIPRHHYKEILMADFRGRGLGKCESVKDFDAALNKYGVKLS